MQQFSGTNADSDAAWQVSQTIAIARTERRMERISRPKLHDQNEILKASRAERGSAGCV